MKFGAEAGVVDLTPLQYSPPGEVGAHEGGDKLEEGMLVVDVVEMPNLFASWNHKAGMKQMLEVMFSGRPILAMQASMRAETQDSADASTMGTATGHLVERCNDDLATLGEGPRCRHEVSKRRVG